MRLPDDAFWMLLLFVLSQGSGAAVKSPGAVRTRRAPSPRSLGWSDATMRLFVKEMRAAHVDPRVVLLGIAASTSFRADDELGDRHGLLMLTDQMLEDVGYKGPLFSTLTAEQQIPWIGRVVAYRISDAGGGPPKSIGDLAVLLYGRKPGPTIERVIRAESQRRADGAAKTPLYVEQTKLLAHVLANPS